MVADAELQAEKGNKAAGTRVSQGFFRVGKSTERIQKSFFGRIKEIRWLFRLAEEEVISLMENDVISFVFIPVSVRTLYLCVPENLYNLQREYDEKNNICIRPVIGNRAVFLALSSFTDR